MSKVFTLRFIVVVTLPLTSKPLSPLITRMSAVQIFQKTKKFLRFLTSLITFLTALLRVYYLSAILWITLKIVGKFITFIPTAVCFIKILLNYEKLKRSKVSSNYALFCGYSFKCSKFNFFFMKLKFINVFHEGSFL